MKLYYSPGACSLSPHIALCEADRAFELDRVDLKTHRTASGEDYLLINPKGYVPALQLDGELLTEGPAIVQYIADLVPDRHLAPPNGTFARYRMQAWLNFIATELHKQFAPLFAADAPAPTQERARSKIGERLTYIAQELTGRPYLMGETFTVADGYLFVMLRWCERYELDVALWPAIDAYYHQLIQRPAIQTALAAEGLVDVKRTRRTA